MNTGNRVRTEGKTRSRCIEPCGCGKLSQAHGWWAKVMIYHEPPAGRKKNSSTKRRVVPIKGDALILKAENPLNDEAAFLCSKRLLPHCIKPCAPSPYR